MNEEPIKCRDCENCIDGKCMYCNGAEITDIDEEFVCMYFSERHRLKCTDCRHYDNDIKECSFGNDPKKDNDPKLGCWDYER